MKDAFEGILAFLGGILVFGFVVGLVSGLLGL